MKKFFTKNKNTNGYAVLELLFYISLFAVLSLVVINAMITMTQAFRETTLQAEFLQGGSIMERISREIRQAYDISSISATSLSLNTSDSAGVNKTLGFTFSGGNIQLIDSGSSVGNLNPTNIVVNDLNFTQITTTEGKAVKIILTITSSNDSQGRTVDFYDTVVLRGSY